MKPILVLTLNELRVLVRDRQAAVLLFGMPAVFVLFLSLALEDVYGEKVGAKLPVVLEVEDEGRAADEVAASLRERGGFHFVERPAGMDDGELFQSGTARAAIRIPAGFSAATDAFLSSGVTGDLGAKGDLGAARIEWSASPTLDASYRMLLQARLGITCMEMVQSALIDGQVALGEELQATGEQLELAGTELERAGAEMESMGAEMETMGTELESLAAQLERATAQLESTAALLERSPAEIEAFAAALAAESAAAAEANALRESLGLEPLAPFASVSPLGTDAPPKGPLVKAAPLFLTPDAASPFPVRRPERGERERWTSSFIRPAEGERRGPGDGLGDARAALESADAELFLRETLTRDVLPTPLQQTVPGWSLFAMFFIVVPLSQGLHRERGEGTLRRILSLGVARPEIVLGKLLPYVLVGLVQFLGMLAVGLYLVPRLGDLALDLGAHPWVLVPITLVCALAATSYGLLVATLARTPEQAAAFGATSVVILSVIGGIMVPHFIMPAALQKAALASPLYWGHRAYLDAFLHDATLSDVREPLLVLSAFGLVCLAIASRRVAR